MATSFVENDTRPQIQYNNTLKQLLSPQCKINALYA